METNSTEYTVDSVEWVSPTTPTLLGDLERLELPPTDLSFHCIQQAIVLPGPLDKARFTASFSYALSRFPHAAGRLRCVNNKWFIALTNSPCPMIYGTSTVELTDKMLEAPHPYITQPTDMGYQAAPTEEPMVKAVVTNWPKTGETTFGFSFAHVLGDGACVVFFVSTMSRFYRNLSPAPTPSYMKFLNPEEPTLEREFICEILPEVPHLAIDYHADVFKQMYDEMMDRTIFMTIKFTAGQLAALWTIACAQAGSNKITKSDAVVAYIATVLSRIAPKPIRQIVNVVDYRGEKGVPGKYDPPPHWAVGNVILQKCSEKLPENRNASIGDYATLMRRNVHAARDPEFIRRYVAIAKELRLRSAATGRLHWWWAVEDSIGVNNLARHNFNEMSFGYTGKERFFLFGDWEKYFRMHPANPVRLPDGTWETYDGGIDVLFRLRKELQAPFLRTVEKDMRDVVDGVGKLQPTL